MDNFSRAFAELIGNEGGFKKQASDHMDWTGGEVGKGELRGTKYGISAGAYPNLDIENLTLDQAKSIYKKDYWDKFNGDSLPYEVSFQLFDADVNHGIGNGSRMMQRALGVLDDGRVGPITLKALEACEKDTFDMRFLAERMIFFTKCSTWDENGRGWARRIAHNLMLAADGIKLQARLTAVTSMANRIEAAVHEAWWAKQGRTWFLGAAHQLSNAAR